MKRGWTTKTVSEVAQHSLGKMLDKSKNKGDFKPYLRNENVRWFSFDLSDLREMRFTDDENGKFTAVKGDVLICEGGYPGRAAIWDENFPIHFQKAIHRVRFREPARNRWFLYYIYWLQSSGELTKHFTGTGIQHFTGQALARLPIPLPPLPEQHRIVAILDKAFAAIAAAVVHAEKNLNSASELFESYLNGVFSRKGEGWVEKKLGDCFKVRSGDFLPAKKMKLGSVDVYGGNGIVGKHNESNMNGENVVIGRVGAKCGNVRYAEGALWLTDNAFSVTGFRYEFDLRFLAYLLDS